jgi:putative phosphoribosyl transferase
MTQHRSQAGGRSDYLADPDSSRIFKNREDAGRQLARRLQHTRDMRPIILALPRGGVPVAYEIARDLGAPLDVFLVRKIGAPGQRELGIGAVAQGGVRILNESAIAMLDVPESEIARITAEETEELQRRLQRFRGDRPLPDLRGRTVILVDDGLATGVSAAAAIRALQRLHPARLILAVPVCAPETAEALRPEVSEVVCALMPQTFMAVGFWYRSFDQTTDEEVVDLLDRARRDLGSTTGAGTETPAPV